MVAVDRIDWQGLVLTGKATKDRERIFVALPSHRMITRDIRLDWWRRSLPHSMSERRTLVERAPYRGGQALNVRCGVQSVHHALGASTPQTSGVWLLDGFDKTGYNCQM